MVTGGRVVLLETNNAKEKLCDDDGDDDYHFVKSATERVALRAPHIHPAPYVQPLADLTALLRGLVVLDNHWLPILLLIVLELLELVPLDLDSLPLVPHQLATVIERLQLALGPDVQGWSLISNVIQLGEAIE